MVTTRAMNCTKPKLTAKVLDNIERRESLESVSEEEFSDAEEFIEDDSADEKKVMKKPATKRARNSTGNLSVSSLVQVGEFQSVLEKTETSVSPAGSSSDSQPEKKKRRLGFFLDHEKPMKPKQREASQLERVTGVRDKVLSILQDSKKVAEVEKEQKPLATTHSRSNSDRSASPVVVDTRSPEVETLSSSTTPAYVYPSSKFVRIAPRTSAAHMMPMKKAYPAMAPMTVPRRIPLAHGQTLRMPPGTKIVQTPDGPRVLRRVHPAPGNISHAPMAGHSLSPFQGHMGPIPFPQHQVLSDGGATTSEIKCIHKNETDRMAWAKINKRCKVGPILDINKLHNLGYYSPRSFTLLQVALVQDLVNSAKVPKHAFQLLKGVEDRPHMKVMVDHNGEILTKKMPIFLSKPSMFLYIRDFLDALQCCPNLVISTEGECDKCAPDCNDKAISEDITEIPSEKPTTVKNEFSRLQEQGARLLDVRQTAEVYRARLGDNVAELILKNDIDSSILQYVDVETIRTHMKVSEACALRIVSIAMELRAESHESLLAETPFRA